MYSGMPTPMMIGPMKEQCGACGACGICGACALWAPALIIAGAALVALVSLW
jgi:hypothetical protein